ncbi:LOW QUALITY PROTEIN: transcriptional regulator ATRX homolog [Homalodisca vitripennis]|uniref:LOW QUALITY PROTEIN: transcriptional regulator ATRX homolog n=1 Tax=Homalodisca vitripennis TaxID=197043 RepID=UPI001EEBA08D|nr:LOW QUALITY PROTEIN: transcriptional regulator ATRX homolog [Homalodisca vitripennis]
MDCDNIGSSFDENLKGNGIKLEKEPDVGNSNIDNENIDTENASKEYKQLRKRELNKPGLDSSVEESDIKIEREDEVENESNDEKIKNKTNSKGKEKKLKTASVRNQRRSKKSNLLDSSDEDDEPSHEKETNLQHILSSDEENKESDQEVKDKESMSPVEVVSSTESSDPDVAPKKKRKKRGSSDSDMSEVLENKKKKKRKLIRCANSSDESGGSGDESVDANKKSTQGESPGKGGRKNIKKIKGKGDLEDATIEAAEEEKERRRRVEERQKLFNEVFEIKETKILDKLVLDFNESDKKELISVNKGLVEKMKPHQAKGVKFMWDSCFESIAQLKKKKGSGCILAHCMGLGKTFQVISLVHTLLINEETQVRTVMVVCPLSTVLNWYNEFDKWLEDIEGGDSIEVFHLTKCKQNPERARELRRWQHNGGVLIMGYEMFRNLTCETAKKFKAKMKKDFQETLVDPGADLIVCDEGHMLKNENTALSKAMSKLKTLRRIVLTGTPMQNNLKEYHCMVQFVKPNLLGTRKEFLNRFVNPISNGQFVDSTESDVKLMKRRAHVLHKMLEGLVQRFDYNVLTPFLPPKHEYVISLCLSELQVNLYKHYLETYSQQSDSTKAGSRLFQDWQALGRIWTHPRVLKMSTDKANLLKEKKMMDESDEEGSLKDFIDDGSDSETTPEESSDNSLSDASIKSNDGKKKKIIPNRRTTRSTRSNSKNAAQLESSGDEKEDNEEAIEESNTERAWWSGMVEPEHLDDINHSAKLVLLFAILRECEMIEDKVLVFSQSLFSLDLIEYFLDKIDTATQENRLEENLGNHQGTWAKGLDYFRLDGSTSSENRNIWCKAFNREDNPRARLFLISTRAGGLGINLTAANRVIIFDASWNPSHDVQSIFRVYRFGQRKPCYVYRFIAHGTMEEKVYDRQVAKQSMSNRVVDEQQVHRHFSMNDLNELYSFTPPSSKEDRPIPALPKDGLMAEILTQYSNWIEKYHEHDSLLENVVEEELNEEERKAAWEDYENDKKRGFIPQTTGTGGSFINPMSLQIENLRRALKAKYPNKPEQELNQMLVYQVSMLMRQQQLAAQNQMEMNAPRPQMYPQTNMTPEQMFNLQQQQIRMQYLQQQQQLQMNQTQHKTANMRNILPKQMDYQQQMLMQQQANLVRMQMQQMQQNMSQNILKNQLTLPNLSNLLNMQPMVSGAAAQLQRMSQSQNYQSPKQSATEKPTQPESSKPST